MSPSLPVFEPTRTHCPTHPELEWDPDPIGERSLLQLVPPGGPSFTRCPPIRPDVGRGGELSDHSSDDEGTEGPVPGVVELWVFVTTSGRTL